MISFTAFEEMRSDTEILNPEELLGLSGLMSVRHHCLIESAVTCLFFSAFLFTDDVCKDRQRMNSPNCSDRGSGWLNRLKMNRITVAE